MHKTVKKISAWADKNTDTPVVCDNESSAISMYIYVGKRDGIPGPKGPGMIPRILTANEIALFHDCLKHLQGTTPPEEIYQEALSQALGLAACGCEPL